jgi:hypothetical protein
MRRLPRPTGPSGPQLTAAARMTAACRWLHGPWLSARGARPWPCTEMLRRPSRSALAMLSSTPPMPPSRRSGAYVVRLYASPASGSGAASDQMFVFAPDKRLRGSTSEWPVRRTWGCETSRPDHSAVPPRTTAASEGAQQSLFRPNEDAVADDRLSFDKVVDDCLDREPLGEALSATGRPEQRSPLQYRVTAGGWESPL